jgi:hypothetical protein
MGAHRCGGIKKAFEQELADVDALLGEWHRWHFLLCKEALAGPSGGLVEQLLDILRELTLRDGRLLVDFINSQDWRSVDHNIRAVCLYAIDGCITSLCERHGTHCFDDPLPDQPPNASLTIKKILFPSPDGEASPGA